MEWCSHDCRLSARQKIQLPTRKHFGHGASGARRREDESPKGQDDGEYRRAWFTTAGPLGHAKDSPQYGLDIL